jgi:DNA-binding response OmpR family regulator
MLTALIKRPGRLVFLSSGLHRGGEGSLAEAKAARPDVPVIMITAYGDPDTKRKVLEGGAEALLTKPTDFVALRSEIDSRVSGAGAEVRCGPV